MTSETKAQKDNCSNNITDENIYKIYKKKVLQL